MEARAPLKFTVQFTTPDATDEVIKDIRPNLSDEEEEQMREEILDTAEKFIRYNEYVSIEFDTETGTATVLKAKPQHT